MNRISRTFRIPADLVDRFDRAAEAKGIDKTEVVVEGIKKFVEACEQDLIWDADRYVFIETVYVPVLGKCHMSDGWLNPPEGDVKVLNRRISVPHRSREDEEGTRYKIENAQVQIDFRNRVCLAVWEVRWIGGLVEKKTMTFPIRIEAREYVDMMQEVTEITVSPAKEA